MAVNMVTERVLRRTSGLLPANVRAVAKQLLFKNRHWAHAALKDFGTIQDLYYWVADGRIDTLLLLQNYFSALYPALDTQTHGTVRLYSKEGVPLGEKSFTLAHCEAPKFRVSSLLEELAVKPQDAFGTLEVNLAIPEEVRAHIQESRGFYFWDRFYIGYTTERGQTCFVHGVDRSHIYRESSTDPIDWYGKPGGHQWAPEIPVDIADYLRFSVILINRTSQAARMTLILSDDRDESVTWEAEVPPKGVHRFELDQHNTAGLNPKEMRMRIQGMATQWGRPVVFKEFTNGAISAMHC